MNNSHEAESKKHNTGCLVMVIGLVLMLAACTMNGGSVAATIGVIGILMVVVGFFPWSNNRSASKIKEDEKMAQAIVHSWGVKVKSGQSLSEKDVDKAISTMGMDGIEKYNKAKKNAAKVVKGAVVGGVVAGETGAVIGAAMAKNKIDSEENSK